MYHSWRIYYGYFMHIDVLLHSEFCQFLVNQINQTILFQQRYNLHEYRVRTFFWKRNPELVNILFMNSLRSQ